MTQCMIISEVKSSSALELVQKQISAPRPRKECWSVFHSIYGIICGHTVAIGGKLEMDDFDRQRWLQVNVWKDITNCKWIAISYFFRRGFFLLVTRVSTSVSLFTLFSNSSSNTLLWSSNRWDPGAMFIMKSWNSLKRVPWVVLWRNLQSFQLWDSIVLQVLHHQSGR